VYIRRSKTVAPTSLSANPVLTIVDHVPLPSLPPLPTVETGPFTSSDSDLPIALRKGK